MGFGAGDRERGIRHGVDVGEGGRDAEDVDHGCRGDDEGCIAQREGEDRTEVVFVLGCGAGFDRVMTGIMGAWGDLIEE
jgi:hypothetical protein